MGWEHTESVVHERVDGVLVASRVTRDVEWDQWQRSLALASIDLEASTDANGIPIWDAHNGTAEDPDGDFRWEFDEVTNYVDRAKAIHEKSWRAANGGDKADMTGVSFHARKVMARTD